MKRVLVLLGVMLLLAAALGAGLATAGGLRRVSLRPDWNGQRRLVVLLIGSDLGPPARPGNLLRGRADAIHIVAVDAKRKRATIVDIPRDSYIFGSKVNAYLSTRGPDGLARVLEDYSGLEIDYWAATSFAGLRRMVDAMDGVPISLPRSMYDAGSGADFSTGRQRLNGEEALSFSRNRKGLVDGDFGRTRNQGRLLRAAHGRLRDHRWDLPALTRLLGTLSRNTETNIPARKLFEFAQLGVSIKRSDVRHVPLSGGVGMVGLESVVYLNPGGAFADIRAGRIGR
ncbi:MAG: LCP family protein [Actinomycetota bacterium]|jgi:LCP family protein required for cell wall assembly|nr:LCP family protein [Euzebyaceae bacterium]MDQ3453445.1 LCP family protein [Actinomycetota bacterium]